jgi:MFS family permease
MVETPVGMKCPDCGRLPLPVVYRMSPSAIAVVVIVAALLGALAGAFLFTLRLGFLTIFLGPFIGGLIGEAASRAAGWKRGRTMAITAAIACGLGIVLLGPQVAVALAAGTVASARSVLTLVSYRPFFLLFALLAVVSAFWRTR